MWHLSHETKAILATKTPPPTPPMLIQKIKYYAVVNLITDHYGFRKRVLRSIIYLRWNRWNSDESVAGIIVKKWPCALWFIARMHNMLNTHSIELKLKPWKLTFEAVSHLSKPDAYYWLVQSTRQRENIKTFKLSVPIVFNACPLLRMYVIV